MNSDNTHLLKLIADLKQKAIEEKAKVWKRIASDLEKSSRQRRIVNLSRINRFTKANDNIVVPGKVLGAGALDHAVNVAAFAFSDQAKQKIIENKGKCLSINELMQQKPKGVRILG
jgi:large subunit ribosomal protein L18e